MSTIKNEDGTFTVTEAIFATKYGTYWAMTPTLPSDKDYVQVSEPYSVTVQPLLPQEVIDNQVTALNEQKAAARAEFNRLTEEIDCKLGQLLCIAHVPEEVSDGEEI